MKHTTIAVDIAKDVFEIAVSRKPGKVDKAHRLSRAKFLGFFCEPRKCNGGNGSLSFSASLWPSARKSRSSSCAASAAHGASVRTEKQDGPSGCERHPRSIEER